MKYAWSCHPVTVVAVIVLLVNDHLLKQAWPGFLTGKLSDVAGLVVAPPLLALLLRRRADLVALLLTGGVFAVVKCTGTGAEVASQAWTLVAGPSRVLADPTDLLALPALALAWWVRRHADTVPTRTRIVFAIPLATLAVTATGQAGPPDEVEGVLVTGDRIIAVNGGTTGDFSSVDGGRTWTRVPANAVVEGSSRVAACVPGQAVRCYRIVPSLMRVEQSDDSGRTWRASWEVPDGRMRMLERSYGDDPDLMQPLIIQTDRTPRSLALVVQPRTGGGHVVVVANGPDGVAVRDQEGRWRRLGIGPGGLSERSSVPLAQPGRHIVGEIQAAVLFGLGALALALTVALPGSASIGRLAALTAVCLAPALILLMTRHLGDPFASLLAYAGLVGAAIMLVVMVDLARTEEGAGKALAVAFATGVFTALGVALPFHGWSAGWPDRYGTAVGLAVLFGLAAATAGCVAALRVKGAGPRTTTAT